MAEPKKILLISYFFAPQNAIGAVRATKLAKYLSRMGHDVTVLCSEGMTGVNDPTLARDLQDLADVQIIREWNPLRDYDAWKRKKKQSDAKVQMQGVQKQPVNVDAAANPKRSGLKHCMLDAVYRILRQGADVSFMHCGIRTLCRMEKRFDIVFSSYGPQSVHRIARKAKQLGLAKKWIADFRDVVKFSFRWQKKTELRYVARIRKHADEICGVSQGYLDTMGLGSMGHVITNGFDEEDLHGLLPRRMWQDGLLHFAYCGQMYGSRRDLKPCFHALRELAEEGIIAKEKIRLDYAGKEQDADAFLAQAKACGLEANVYNHGILPRDEAIRMQLAADVIFIAAWNTPDCAGNLPGKLLEALMMERPIVCCISGEVPQSEAASLIAATGIGCCYEQAEGDASLQQMKRYLRRICEAFAEGTKAEAAVHRQQVQAYTYPAVACKVEALFED